MFGKRKKIEEDLGSKVEQAQVRAKWEKRFSEYLLTSSVEDYVGSVGKSLPDYEQVSVDGSYTSSTIQESEIFGKIEIVRKGEVLGAEKVVAIRPTLSDTVFLATFYMIGTALIPKKPDYKDSKGS